MTFKPIPIVKKSAPTPVPELTLQVKNGSECYFDPIRKKYVGALPEEIVRQKLLLELLYREKVPKELIRVEAQLKHFGNSKNSTKKRADILLLRYDKKTRESTVSMVIECKAAEVPLGHLEIQQVLEYGEYLKSAYAYLTNGEDECFFARLTPTGKLTAVDYLPSFSDLWKSSYIPEVIEELPYDYFYSLEDMEDTITFSRNEFFDVVGTETEPSKAVVALNLQNCFMNTDETLTQVNSTIFDFVKDLGTVTRKYSNPSGGYYHGKYRCFEILRNNNTEIISFRVWGVVRGYTSLCVARDSASEGKSHHALQYNLDKYLDVRQNIFRFFHNGKMDKGSIRGLEEVAKENAPHLLGGKHFFLGGIKQDDIFSLEDPNISKFITTLMEYAIIRDIYRLNG